MKQFLGIKKGMTRVYEGDKVVPVTILDITGLVLARKEAKGVMLGIGKKRSAKALSGKYKELGYVPQHRVWVEGEYSDINIGDFKPELKGGESVEVRSISKGKGFAGVVKRWGFAGGPKTHGQSDRHRAPGSIGAGTTPGRVLKGKKMAGRMGGDQVTLKNKRIVAVKDSYVLISGPIPGNNGDMVSVHLNS